MNKILVICGPTATGKTSLGIRLAKMLNGELISADSRQVYKGMDIITGKDQPSSTKIHLIDVIEPNQDFNVAEYYRLAWQAIEKIWKASKLPIIVGGAGFYIQAVIKGIESMSIPPNLQLRKKLAGKSVTELFSELEKLDPFRAAKMNISDRNNPRRLVRAIEIALQIRNSKSVHGESVQDESEIRNKFQIQNPEFKTNDILFIGLKAPYKILYQRIDSRVDKRVKQGAEKEISHLLKKGYRWENSAMGVTIGYREWRLFFEKKETREEIIRCWKFAEHAYARRQMTWYRKTFRQAQGKWFDITDKKCQDKVKQLVSNWYGTKN